MSCPSATRSWVAQYACESAADLFGEVAVDLGAV
jgi:hypothetical protein